MIAALILAQAAIISGKVESTPPKYLADTVVYVKDAPGGAAPKTASMDQKGMKFIPRIFLATAGDTVRFLNHDGVDHNVYSPDNEGYNLGMIHQDAGGEYRFARPGVYTQLCSVHPEMIAWVFVGQNPYSAVVGKDGRFKIEGVPAGTWKVGVWNPQLKAADQAVTVAAGKTAETSFAIKR